MEPLPGIAAYAVVFDRAHGARLEAAERFVLTLPALFPDSLVGCDLGWQAASRIAAVVVRCAQARFGPDAQRRLSFWCARAGVRATPLAELPDAQRAAFHARFEVCEPRLAGVPPDRLHAAAESFFTAAGARADRPRPVPRAPVLLMDVKGPGWEGVRWVPGERTLFVPGVLAPPEGDPLRLALRFPGEDRPLECDARVVGVRRAEEARSGGGTAGFALALEEGAEAVAALDRLVAGLPPRPARSENRVHPRYQVMAPVVVEAREDAAAVVAAPPVPSSPLPADAPAARIEYASDEELASDYVENLSQGGAFVRTANPSPVGTRLALSMQLPGGEELSAPAVVVCTLPKGMGVKFELSDEAEIRLAEVIARISARPRRALVVDDDAVVRKMLQDALVARGFEVLTAEDGAAGLSVLSEELLALDLLVTDVNMPNMDGESFVRTIRNAGGESDLAIVVVGGAMDQALEKRLELGGADAVLDKALGPELLAQAADAVLERKRQRRG
jgi:uncharacterized protein (TIGR02266 family)